uniref:DUF834 domain-containing protein n=1 Tax=Oryza sativa subsp. japonica TaxID=39947 RepID=Q60EV5_ORYSJ|nr:hypothetical protein [Oryza sativa Japonica Group]
MELADVIKGEGRRRQAGPTAAQGRRSTVDWDHRGGPQEPTARIGPKPIGRPRGGAAGARARHEAGSAETWRGGGKGEAARGRRRQGGGGKGEAAARGRRQGGGGNRLQQPATWNGGGRPEDSGAHGDGDAPQEAAVGKKGGREKKGREERSLPEAAADAEEEDGDDDCPMAACEDGGRTGGAAAEVLLVLAELREATARVDVDRSGGATRLESAVAAERDGERGGGVPGAGRGNGVGAGVRRGTAMPMAVVAQRGSDGSGGGARLEVTRGGCGSGARWMWCFGGVLWKRGGGRCAAKSGGADGAAARRGGGYSDGGVQPELAGKQQSAGATRGERGARFGAKIWGKAGEEVEERGGSRSHAREGSRRPGMVATWAVFGGHGGNGSCRPEVGDDRWAHGSHLSAKEEREAGWGGKVDFGEERAERRAGPRERESPRWGGEEFGPSPKARKGKIIFLFFLF